jgi:pimeloyl-ACP methyl ester carboxylesterase
MAQFCDALGPCAGEYCDHRLCLSCGNRSISEISRKLLSAKLEQKINGIVLYEEGPSRGLPIIFIHGFPFSHAMWEPQRLLLSKTHRVISYDVRGHGKSQVGDGQYHLEFFVDDLTMVMDHLKIRQAVLCGLSMGGYIALRAVERYPDRFSGLILCDTKSQADSNEAKVNRARAIRTVKKEGVGPFADKFVKTVLCENTLQTKPALVKFVLDLIGGNSVLGISGTLLALAARTDATQALAKMALPTLILVGKEDKLTPPSASESMLKLFPRATMHVIPEAGHMSNLENPSVFNDHMLGYLQQFGG